jgi:ribose transport system permease protein
MANTVVGEASATPPNMSLRRFLARNQNVLIIWAVLLIVILVSSQLSESFTNPRNFPNIMRQSAALVLVSIGQTFVLLIGGIDLSVGSTISLVVVSMAAIMEPTPESMIATAIVGLLIGAAVGLANGLLITRFRLAPFMVTLATLSIVQGIALQLRQNPQATIPREFSPIFTSDIGGVVPIPFLIIIIATTLAALMLRQTSFGRRLYAVGSNENAVQLSGLSTNRIKVLAYMLTGFMAGAAGVFIAARSRAGDPLIGSDFAFDSITAVVLGGARLSGGVGSVWGTLAGVFIITILSNILNLTGVPSNYQYILKGVLLALAVMLYRRK